jgi:hypothetical protein
MNDSNLPKIKPTFDGCYNYERLKKENMVDDWRYSDERLELRGQCLKVLLNKYGGNRIDQEAYSTQDIYECVDTWISQGNKLSTGIVAYFNAYFNPQTKQVND